jgi:pterin-4a-carbinolamine dehydratase
MHIRGSKSSGGCGSSCIMPAVRNNEKIQSHTAIKDFMQSVGCIFLIKFNFQHHTFHHPDLES